MQDKFDINLTIVSNLLSLFYHYDDILVIFFKNLVCKQKNLTDSQELS
jgi:hypothetical protein